MLSEIYSIPYLLKQDSIKHNKSKLAKVLKICRNTITKYENDKESKKHIFIKINDKYVFFVAPRYKH